MNYTVLGQQFFYRRMAEKLLYNVIIIILYQKYNYMFGTSMRRSAPTELGANLLLLWYITASKTNIVCIMLHWCSACKEGQSAFRDRTWQIAPLYTES